MTERLNDLTDRVAQLLPDARRLADEVTTLALEAGSIYATLGAIGGSLVEDAAPGTESASWDALYDVTGWAEVHRLLAVIAGAVDRAVDGIPTDRYYEESALAAELVVIPAAP